MTGDDGEAAFARRHGKSEAAFRTISEVAEDLDVPQHVLRFWESRFPQVKPLKRGGGRRYYRPEDVALLRRIRDLLYSEGYTIKGVQKLLRDAPANREEAAPPRQDAPELPLPAGSAESAAAEGEEVECPGVGADAAPQADDRPGQDFPAEDGSVEDEERSGGQSSALPPGMRRKLEDLLGELEEIRGLLQPRS